MVVHQRLGQSRRHAHIFIYFRDGAFILFIALHIVIQRSDAGEIPQYFLHVRRQRISTRERRRYRTKTA